MNFVDTLKSKLFATNFSEMKGVVLLNGQPVEGAVVTRIAKQNDKPSQVQEMTTEADGTFYFRPLFGQKPFLFEYIVAQQVLVQYNGKEYEAWSFCKRKIEPFKELGDPSPSEATHKIINCEFELTRNEDQSTKVHYRRLGEITDSTLIFGLMQLK